MSYRIVSLKAEGDSVYPPAFMESLREHQEQGWSLILIAWDGDNPVVVFEKAARNAETRPSASAEGRVYLRTAI